MATAVCPTNSFIYGDICTISFLVLCCSNRSVLSKAAIDVVEVNGSRIVNVFPCLVDVVMYDQSSIQQASDEEGVLDADQLVC